MAVCYNNTAQYTTATTASTSADYWQCDPSWFDTSSHTVYVDLPPAEEDTDSPGKWEPPPQQTTWRTLVLPWEKALLTNRKPRQQHSTYG